MWPLLLLTLALFRCHSCSGFQPVRRYHPATKFNSNTHDDLVTAENFQYAYGGGESQGVVDYTHSHDVDLGHEHDQIGGADHTHHGVTSPDHIETSGFDQSLTSGFDEDHHYPTGFDQGHHHPLAEFGQSHHHEPGSGFQSPSDPQHAGEVDLSGAESDQHLTAYSYGPAPGYGYGPPVLHSLPAITTPAPAQQAKQSPGYTYYYLGRHLWYIPLYFSIYFILYVGALVLKSVARHKILFPDNLKVAAQQQARALRQLHLGDRKFYM